MWSRNKWSYSHLMKNASYWQNNSILAAVIPHLIRLGLYERADVHSISTHIVNITFLHLWIQNSTSPGSTCYGNHSYYRYFNEARMYTRQYSPNKITKAKLFNSRQTAPKTSKEPRLSIQQRDSKTEIWNIHLLYLVCVRVYWISAPDLAGLESVPFNEIWSEPNFQLDLVDASPDAVHSVN